MRRAVRTARDSGATSRGRRDAILPGSIAELPCGGRSAGAILTEPSAPGRSRVTPSEPSSGSPGATSRDAETGIPRPSRPWLPRCRLCLRDPSNHPPQQDRLSTEWTPSRSGAPPSASSRCRSRRPTSRRGCATPQLIDVDDQRFRIAVPNGFAKDWLETRYRSLISQTLARIVGYSVQVEFTVQRDRWRRLAGEAERCAGRRRNPLAAGRPGRAGRGSAARAARPTSTRATRSRTSSSARPTASPTRRACRSRSARATPTTRCSCTAGWASARPT